MSEKSRCSNCDNELEENKTVCLSCNNTILDQPDMPDVDLDGFESDQPDMPDVDLDGFESDQPDMPNIDIDGFESDQPDMPDVDIDGFESDQPDMPNIDIDGFDDDNNEEFDLDFVDNSTNDDNLDFLDTITTKDEDLDFLDTMIVSTKIKEEKSDIISDDLDFLDSVIAEPVEQETKIDKILENEIPDLPEFDELLSDDIDKDIEIKEKVIVNNLTNLGIKGQLRLFLPQWSYWFVIFALISFTSLEVINPNFDPNNMKYGEDYHYRNLFMLVSWVSFIVMGFYFKHTLTKIEIDPHTKYVVLFLVGQFLFIYILSYVGLLLFNPQLLNGVYLKYNYFLTAFFIFTVQNFIISFLSFGIVGIFIGYKLLWEFIFDVEPVSKSVISTNH